MPLGDFSKKKKTGTSTKGAAKKEKGFLGIDLPAIGIGGHNLVDLPKIGVNTDKHNPITQVEDLVTGFPAGLVRLGTGLSSEVGGLMGHTKGFSQKETPLTKSLVTSPIETAKTLNPADIPKIAQGNFGDTALGKRVKKEGVLGTGLSTLSDVTLAAGGLGLLGKAAGFGKLAQAAKLEELAGASARAAGLGKEAKVADLAEAATKAAARGDVQAAVDLQKAAGQLDEALKLRVENTNLPSKITEKAVDVSRLGEQIGNIPAKPYQLLGKGAAKATGAAADVLAKTPAGEAAVAKTGNIVKYAGDKIKIADLYHRTVTRPTQEALFRLIDRGEAPQAITAELSSRYPAASEVFQKFADDLEKQTAGVGARPKGNLADTASNLQRDIWSKTPAEWEAELEPALAKYKQAKESAAALADGDPAFKTAQKTIREAKAEVDRLSAMRKMSMQEPINAPPPPQVEEALSPKAATATEEAAVAGDAAHGPNYEEVKAFNKQNVKAMRSEFHNQLQETFAPGLTAESVVPDVQVPGHSKINLDEVLKAKGYTAWDPVTGVELTGKNIKPTSPVIQNEIFEVVTRYSKYNQLDKANTIMGRAYDSATGKWKHTVLALSPRWHFGNVVGNLAMAVGAGLNPIDIVKYGNQARTAVRNGESPAALLSSGYHFSEEAMNALAGPTPKGFVEAMKHPIQWSYNMNQYVDDVNRTMIYLAKKSEGVSSQAAVDIALKAAGDFGRLTPFEKNVMRRIMPFYTWQKHITKLAFRLPLEDPARVAWTLHLAEMGDRLNPDPGAEGFYNNTIGVGGLRLNMQSADPFGSSMFASGLGKEAVGRSINPLLGTATAMLTGKSLKRGLENVRQPGVEFGEKGQPLLQNPGEAAGYLAQQVPQVRQLQDLVAGKTKTRLDTGEPAETQYPQDAQNRWQQLLKLAGVDLRPNLKGEPSKAVSSKTKKKSTRKGGLGSFKK